MTFAAASLSGFVWAVISAFVHVVNFVAPAVVCGFFVACTGSLLGTKRSFSVVFRGTLINAAAGLLVLIAGLIIFGRDGKMATYAAFVVALALAQTAFQGGVFKPTARRGR